MAAESWVWLAHIRRPQGRKGEVFADVWTDFPDKFAERKRLWLLPPSASAEAPKNVSFSLDPRPVVLCNHWLHKGGIVLHFDGVDSISAAEALAGLIVAIPAEERATLDDDAYYIFDLVGCELIDVAAVGQPTSVGTVRMVDRSAGPVALLSVETPRGEVLIPFAKSFLRTVDLAAKRLEMALPDGLVELNLR